MAQRRPSDQEMKRLAQYWFRAELMREQLHALRDAHGPDLSGLNKDSWWEFEAYLMHWLGALFVIVEGFNKLKLADARVQILFNAHLGLLKRARHETYHFVVETSPLEETLIRNDGLNWAEDLHDAIGDSIKEVVNRRATIEKFVEWRQTRKMDGGLD